MTKEKLGKRCGGFFKYETLWVEVGGCHREKKRGWWLYKFPAGQTCGATFAPEFAGYTWGNVEIQYSRYE